MSAGQSGAAKAGYGQISFPGGASYDGLHSRHGSGNIYGAGRTVLVSAYFMEWFYHQHFIPSEQEKTDERTKELIYKNIMIPVVLILNAVYFENALDKENIQIVYAVLIAGFIGLVQLPLLYGMPDG